MTERQRRASDALVRCLRVLDEGAEGYAAAFTHTEDRRLRAILDLRRAERAAFARVLRRLAAAAHLDVDRRFTPSPKWFDAADLGEGIRRDRSIVAACQRGDAAAVVAFDRALETSEGSALDDAARGAIKSQREAIANALSALAMVLGPSS